MYWFQLDRRIGPVVINITRVALDLTTIISTYLAILTAFSLGILFVLNSKLYTYTKGGSNKITNSTIVNEEIPEETEFLSELMVMFWAILNPGPDPDAVPDQGISGIMANILFAMYQISLAIILLNLLIAMMNSTMQKIADKKLLYWKFVRTSVWLDFISTKYVIPPPANIILLAIFVPLHIIGYSIYSLSRLLRKYKNPRSAVNNISKSKSGSVRRKCVLDPVEGKRRKAHALLLKTLIKRYLCQEVQVEHFSQRFGYKINKYNGSLDIQKA